MDLLYLAKEPDQGVMNDLEQFKDYDITICACNPGYVDYYKLLGYNVIDYREVLKGIPMRFDVVIGNPPYGSGGNLAIKFLNKSLDLSDKVTMVLPISIRKPSSVNKIRLDAICTDDVTLPDDTFPGSIRTVRQTWVKTDSLRSKIETFTTHPDFEFVKKDENPDCMIFRCGASTGKLTFTFEDNKPDHYYIKASDSVIDKLRQISPELINQSKETNGMPGISKHLMIETYMKHFGRGKLPMYYTHPDFEFVKKDENPDIMIGRIGSGPAGRVKLSDFGHYCDDHYFIKTTPPVINNLVNIADELRELSESGNGRKTLSKHDLISCYMKHFGRGKLPMYYTHPDFEFVSYDQRHEANVFIGIKGGGPAGRVKTENFEHYADTGHHLIKCNKEVQERLVALEPQFREEALITQIPSLGKNELISIYMKNYPND